MSNKIKKATLQELANYLGVSLSAVKQYNKKKRLLMQIGLAIAKEKTRIKIKVCDVCFVCKLSAVLSVKNL